MMFSRMRRYTVPLISLDKLSPKQNTQRRTTMIRSISILLTLVHTSYAQTKYATALIRNSDGETNDIQGVVKFTQYVLDRKMSSRNLFFFFEQNPTCFQFFQERGWYF